MTTCARCSSPLEPGDLRCPICAEVTPAALQEAAREGLVARVMRCEGCGAATRYSAEARGLRCAFCAAVMRVELLVVNDKRRCDAFAKEYGGTYEGLSSIQKSDAVAAVCKRIAATASDF